MITVFIEYRIDPFQRAAFEARSREPRISYGSALSNHQSRITPHARREALNALATLCSCGFDAPRRVPKAFDEEVEHCHDARQAMPRVGIKRDHWY